MFCVALVIGALSVKIVSHEEGYSELCCSCDLRFMYYGGFPIRGMKYFVL